MKRITRILALAALASLPACDQAGTFDEFRDAGECTFEPDGDVQVVFDVGLRVLDLETGLEVFGDVCMSNDASLSLGRGVTLDPDGAPSFTPDPFGAAFNCSCNDVNGVRWTQACSDPPHYGCTQCCDANGGDSTTIKIKPPGSVPYPWG